MFTEDDSNYKNIWSKMISLFDIQPGDSDIKIMLVKVC
jgi:hypothetical protein